MIVELESIRVRIHALLSRKRKLGQDLSKKKDVKRKDAETRQKRKVEITQMRNINNKSFFIRKLLGLVGHAKRF